MATQPTYRLAFSSCPNDTFIFKAIARQLIDLKGYQFDLVMEDVETLNQNAAMGRYEITKLSFAALGKHLDRYGLLRSGAALGEGCGPLIISMPGRTLTDQGRPAVAVPGMGTTACHLFRMYLAETFPGLDFKLIAMPFETIMPAVREGRVDFGVIIHEGRFVFQNAGFELKQDLGRWWEETTGLPIPLGGIAVRRDLPVETARDIETLIRQSINHGLAHPDMAYDYVQTHSQELNEAVIQQHIDLYVNDYSKLIGDRGEESVIVFFEKAREAGLMTPSDQPLFAC